MMCAQNVRSGNYGVVAANHTLILNWNDQTVPLLRQIALNRTERADDTYDGCAISLKPCFICLSAALSHTLCACTAYLALCALEQRLPGKEGNTGAVHTKLPDQTQVLSAG